MVKQLIILPEEVRKAERIRLGTIPVNQYTGSLKSEVAAGALTAADAFAVVGDTGAAGGSELFAARLLAGNERAGDAVAVYRRGNQLLYANNRTPDGRWAQPPGAQAAVETERHHTWTYPEAQDFLDTSRRIATGLGPQWAPQLQEIKNLARPFLPPGAEAHAEAAVGNHTSPARARPGSAATPQKPGPPPRGRDDLDAGSER